MIDLEKELARLKAENDRLKIDNRNLLGALRDAQRKGTEMLSACKRDLQAPLRALMNTYRHECQTAFACVALSDNHPMSKEDIFEARMDVFPGVSCGIYFLLMGDEIVYVGQSLCVHSRIAQHFRDKDFDSWSFLQVPEKQLDVVESFYIAKFRPRLNKGPARYSMDQLVAFGVVAASNLMAEEVFCRAGLPWHLKILSKSPIAEAFGVG